MTKYLLLALALAASATAAPAKFEVSVNWAEEKLRTSTAATIEVDVMPFLGRTEYGGPFNADEISAILSHSRSSLVKLLMTYACRSILQTSTDTYLE